MNEWTHKYNFRLVSVVSMFLCLCKSKKVEPDSVGGTAFGFHWLLRKRRMRRVED